MANITDPQILSLISSVETARTAVSSAESALAEALSGHIGSMVIISGLPYRVSIRKVKNADGEVTASQPFLRCLVNQETLDALKAAEGELTSKAKKKA